MSDISEAYLAAYKAADRMLGQVVADYLALEAENARLSRWLKAAWDQPECPECGEYVEFGKSFDHAPGCEFAAWLGSRERKEQG